MPVLFPEIGMLRSKNSSCNRWIQMKPFNFMRKMFKWALAPAIAMVVTLSAHAEWDYPDMSATGPEVEWPEEGFAPFNLPVTLSTNGPTAGTPEISEWTRQNNPGDTMALSAEGLNNSTEIHADGDSANLLVNGTFDSNVDSWDLYGVSVVWNAGKATVTKSGSFGGMYQAFTLTGGVEYSFSATSSDATVSHQLRLCLGAEANGGVYSTASSTTGTNFSFTYTPSATATYNLYLRLGGTGVVSWDNVYVTTDAGETVVADTESTQSGLVGFVFASDNVVEHGEIQRIDGRLAAVTLPENLPDNEFYLMWALNEYGFGEPVGINKTDAWWCGPYYSSTGSVLSVFGENLDLGDGLAQLYIEGHGWVTNNGTYNPYKVDFVVPSTLTNGTYTAYAHNGHGGKYGWSEQAVTFTVETPLEWYFDNDGYPDADVTDPTTWYNSKGIQYSGDAPGAVGDGVTDDGYSIAECADWILTRDCATMYFPAGTYSTSNNVMLNNRFLRLKGAGMDATKLIPSDNYAPLSYQDTFVLMRTQCIIQDLEINRGNMTGNTILATDSSEGNRFDMYRVRLNVYNGTDVEDARLNIPHADYYRIIDCQFLVNDSLNIGGGDEIFMTGCTFKAFGDANTLVGWSGSHSCFANNTVGPYDISDASSSLGWSKGRWIAGGGAAHKIYIAGNTTTNMAPRYADPFFRAAPIAVSEWVWEDPESTGDFDKATQTWTFESLPPDRADYSLASIGPPGLERNDEFYHKVTNWDTNAATISVINLSVRLAEPGVTSNLEVIAWDGVDQNSGEQILWETTPTHYTGTVTTVVNATNLYFADCTIELEDNEVLTITSGRGMGQSARIITADSGDGYIALETPLRVLPDETSQCMIGRYISRIVIYDNDFSGTAGTGDPDRSTATTMFSAFGSSSRVVVDGNTARNMNSGIALWATGEHGVAMEPCTFDVVKNNAFDNCAKALQLEVGGNEMPYETCYFGNVYRKNTITDSQTTSFYLSAYEGERPMDMCVYDRNVSDTGNATFTVDTYDEIYNQVLVDNSFEQDGGTGLTVTKGDSFILRDNTWTGFDANYAGTTAGWLEVPVRLIELDAGSGSLEIWNSGTAALKWSATIATNNWLELNAPTSGTVENEKSTGQLSFTMTTEPAVESQAVITVTAGEQTRVIRLEYKGGGVVAVRSQTWPILPDSSGRALRAELYDVDSEQTNYVYGLEESLELQQPSPDREVMIRIQVQEGDQWIDVESQGYK
jgi:hypothetical protein